MLIRQIVEIFPASHGKNAPSINHLSSNRKRLPILADTRGVSFGNIHSRISFDKMSMLRIMVLFHFEVKVYQNCHKTSCMYSTYCIWHHYILNDFVWFNNVWTFDTPAKACGRRIYTFHHLLEYSYGLDSDENNYFNAFISAAGGACLSVWPWDKMSRYNDCIALRMWSVKTWECDPWHNMIWHIERSCLLNSASCYHFIPS